MFNVAILRMKDIVKFLTGIFLTILLVVIISQIHIEGILKETAMQGLKQTIPAMTEINEEEKDILSKEDSKIENNILEIMLKTQISSIKGMEEIEKKETKEIKNEEVQTANEKVEQQEDGIMEIARNRTKNRNNYK